MKALIYTRYGKTDVLQLKEVSKPIPRDNEVLVKVFATTVNRTDCATIRAKPFFMRLVTGLLRPLKQTPGTAFAGKVETVGRNVSSVNVGDEVFGFDDQGAMAHAEYTSVSENKIVRIPNTISFDQAAASIEGAHYAYNFINKVAIGKEHKVLVNGATGAIGSAAVQLIKYFGAEVTAVCATKHIDLVKSLGADKVIDYTCSDFTKDDQQYDYIFDAVGKSSFLKCKHLLNTGGVYISSDLGYMWQNLILPLVTGVISPLLGGKKTIFPTPKNIQGSLLLVKELMEQRKFKAVIDSEYPLKDIVDAYEYVEKGHKLGNIVITVGH